MVMEVAQKVARPCVHCKELTKYICIDCAIDEKGFVPLCQGSFCKRQHKIEEHANLTAASA